ncbi:MAG TPA: hypothetical protein VF622_18955 [Segetibacter sp.]|jgi:hypothetical protein
MENSIVQQLIDFAKAEKEKADKVESDSVLALYHEGKSAAFSDIILKAELLLKKHPNSDALYAKGTVTRKEIEASIQAKKEAIKTIKTEIVELSKQSLLFSDEEQWFTEKLETVTYRENRKKVSVEKLIGRRHWNEDFRCENTGKVITIERSEVIRIDGQWEW